MPLHRLVPTQLGSALRLIWDSSRGWTVAGVVLLVVQAALSLAALALVKLVVDAVAAGLASTNPAGTFEHVAVLIGLVAGVALLTALCKSLESAISDIQRDLVSDHMNSLVHAKAGEVDVEYY